MTTVQIVGIAVAAAVVLLLVIALVVTRRRGRLEPPPPGTSFLDLSPQDTLDELGRAEQPVEDVTLESRALRSLLDGGAAGGAGVAADRAPVTPATPSEDPTGRVEPVATPGDTPPALANGALAGDPAASTDASPPTATADLAGDADPAADPPAAASARNLSLDWGVDADAPDFTPVGGDRPPWGTDPLLDPPEMPERPFGSVALSWTTVSGGGDNGGGGVASRPPGDQAPRKVPLADIIVTTSRKVIDLDDPEVRRMLTDLVKFEIDQATRYREQGQNLDAVLQLTEAEKISRALGMSESAQAIHLMMRELQR